MRPPPIRIWNARGRSLALGAQTRVMAVLNLTPDSFYPASRSAGPDALLAAAEAALAAGADILDLGAESTRPGAQPLAVEEELGRLIPPLAALRRRWPQAWISADTRHAQVARAALDAGADIINDVSGLGAGGGAGAAAGDALAAVIAAANCGAVLMHSRGDFATMDRLPPLADVVGTVHQDLLAITAHAAAAGIPAANIVVDPGFGFGKNGKENWTLLAGLSRLRTLGFPVLAGLSRKSFIGRALADAPPEQRLFGTIAAVTAAALHGADIVRVHDVAATRDAVRVADAVRTAREPEQ